MRTPYLGLSLSLALALGGCTKHDSDNILTSGMYASINASAEGNGQTQVTATLFLGNPVNLDFIELQGDDQLEAERGDGTVKDMLETNVLNVVSYGATFDSDDGETTFSVHFLRTVDDGAPFSLVTLPAPFDITTAPPASASRAADLVIDWAPAGTGDTMSWRAEGDCISLVTGAISGDPGTLTIPAGTLVKRDGASVPDECGVTVRIQRTRPGTLDQGYGEGGTITGEQTRLLAFVSGL